MFYKNIIRLIISLTVYKVKICDMTTILTGTIIDCIAILVAGIIGINCNKRIDKTTATDILNIIALIAMVVGISMALESANILVSMVSLILGLLIGRLLNLQSKATKISRSDELFDFTQEQNDGYVSAFIIASLISLIGPLSVVGAFENGIHQDYSLLLLKSGFDFVSTLVLASSLGRGVIFSIIPVFIVQSVISLFGAIFKDGLSDSLITEFSAIGGIIFIAMALTVLNIKKFEVVNLLPGFVVLPVFYLLFLNLGLL
ncbi:DUF554 family protein [Candidatus Dojkabacteria bacterium]|nr:DUF554 family protein [Candidatus Dojkabacteria bacterium]